MLGEALRDLSRPRFGAAKNLVHARQHVKAVPLRHCPALGRPARRRPLKYIMV